MKIPSATYRLQFNRNFGFKKAGEILDYLASIGVSTIYASPVFKARPGSTHGYDITDPNMINPELGTKEELYDLILNAGRNGIDWLQDIVPNHQAFSGDNYIVSDILENGRNSKYFNFLDINLDHPYIKGRLLIPFLGKLFGETLENGEISLNYDARGFYIKYYEHEFPLRIESYNTILTKGLKPVADEPVSEESDFIQLLGIIHILKNLPAGEEMDERYEQIGVVKKLLWELYSNKETIRKYIDEAVAGFNGEKGEPGSFKLLDNLLSEQNFRLSFWKVSGEEINYRRFFNINELICIKVENDDVFDHTHQLVFELLEQENICGIRIDHIDGLYDPSNYLKKVRKKAGDKYIAVEKILEHWEQIPDEWPVQGTTGYDFLNFVNGLYCLSESREKLTRTYNSFIRSKMSYGDLLYEKKKMIIEKHLTGDIDNLAHLLKQVSARDRYGSDITLNGLMKTLIEIASVFPVYRTYINSRDLSTQDSRHIKDAVNETRRRNPDLAYEINFLEKFLLFEFFEHVPEEERKGWIDFVMRFQQLTGPLMAKGFEDTTLYIYNRLISLNEVGGDPDKFGVSAREFHEFNKTRADSFPHTINATSTHDTKRGEDIRARINVLSEIPDEWGRKLKLWAKKNRAKKIKSGGINVPDRNDEYFLYQSMVGGFPFYKSDYKVFTQRLKEYVVKAVREAKVHTAWLQPDKDYENGFLVFIDRIMKQINNDFFDDFISFQKKISYYGVFNSLSQTLLKMTSPGLPDFYQGTELWDLYFVDPDNRRPVDFDKRRKLINEIKKYEISGNIKNYLGDIISSVHDGRIKFYLTHKSLEFRRINKDLYDKGDYTVLKSMGQYNTSLIAFSRSMGNNTAVTVVPRFISGIVDVGEMPLDGIWENTSVDIPESISGSYRNVLTDERIKLGGSSLAVDMLKNFPVALLVKEN